MVMARPQGAEGRLAVLETAVLPLGHGRAVSCLRANSPGKGEARPDHRIGTRPRFCNAAKWTTKATGALNGEARGLSSFCRLDVSRKARTTGAPARGILVTEQICSPKVRYAPTNQTGHGLIFVYSILAISPSSETARNTSPSLRLRSSELQTSLKLSEHPSHVNTTRFGSSGCL